MGPVDENAFDAQSFARAGLTSTGEKLPGPRKTEAGAHHVGGGKNQGRLGANMVQYGKTNARLCMI